MKPRPCEPWTAWTGYISFVAVWDKVLTPSEIYLLCRREPATWEIVLAHVVMLLVVALIVVLCKL